MHRMRRRLPRLMTFYRASRRVVRKRALRCRNFRRPASAPGTLLRLTVD